MATPIRWTPSPSPTRSPNPEHVAAKMVESEISSYEHEFQYREPTLRINSETQYETPGEANYVGKDHEVRSEGRGDGVYLTWEDLGVTVSDRKKGTREILQGLTGYAQPGELLAIMGPSGCGKSTLLDALAGKSHFFLNNQTLNQV